MQKLTFQFSTMNEPVSAIIRFHTLSEISHVDAVCENGDLLGSRYHESDGDGVQERKAGYANFTKKILVTIDVTDEEALAFWSFLRAQLGKPYDLGAIFGLALHHNWRDENRWFCSELQAAALQAARIVSFSTAANWISPEMLRVVLTSMRGAVQVTL